MAFLRGVITALDEHGNDILGTTRIGYRVHDESIVSGSLLTVESNHFAVVKSRGLVLDTYDPGQYAIKTPDKPILGAFTQGLFGGRSPWVYEVIYVNRSKLMVRNTGVTTTKEMAEVSYAVDYYVHVDTREQALALITHMPFNGSTIDTTEIADYAGPAIEQAINQVIQVTPLENINEKIIPLREEVKAHLAGFLNEYGIFLNDLKILITASDPQIRQLLSLRALGLPEEKLGPYYLALRMVEKGLLTAPNAAAGLPFNIGGDAMVSLGGDLLGRGTGSPASPWAEKP